MEEAETEKNKIESVKAKALTSLTASRQIISTPGLTKKMNKDLSGETPKRTPVRLGL
jgi:hypothetical protein